MTFRRLVLSSRLFLVAGLVSLLGACASKAPSSSGATITKVNPYHLKDVNEPIPAADPAIAFIRAEILHGAISTEERVALQGNYFTIFWESADREPATVRLEYRQMNTNLTVKKLEQQVPAPKRKNTTKFALNGTDYVTNGPVTSWRALVMRGNTVLAEYKSYLWE